VKEGKKKRLL